MGSPVSSSILSRSASFSSMAALSCLASSAVTLGSVDDAAISAFTTGCPRRRPPPPRRGAPHSSSSSSSCPAASVPTNSSHSNSTPSSSSAGTRKRSSRCSPAAIPSMARSAATLRLGVVGAAARAAVLGDCSGVVERHDGAVEVQAVSRGELAQVEAEGVGGVREGGGGTRVRPGAEEASGAALAFVLLLVPVGEVALLAIVAFVVAHRGVLRAYPECGDGPAVGPMRVGGLIR